MRLTILFHLSTPSTITAGGLHAALRGARFEASLMTVG